MRSNIAYIHNILGIIDTTGNLVVQYNCNAYGNNQTIIGNQTLGNINPFRYKGYYYDKESDMYYCNSRYYNPKWCRWLNADSVNYLIPTDINSTNLYQYCANNPIMNVDFSGNMPKWLKKIAKKVTEITSWLSNNIGFETRTIIDEVDRSDYIVGGYEVGTSITTSSNNKEKSITFYFQKPKNWTDFLDYKIGFEVQNDYINVSRGIGLWENDFSIGTNEFTMDFVVGIDKIGFGWTTTYDKMDNYQLFYADTLSLAFAVALCGYGVAALESVSTPFKEAAKHVLALIL